MSLFPDSTWLVQLSPGVRGGILARTTIFTTIAAGASESTIQTALNACPSGQAVKLSEGTYTITSGLKVKAGTTLRGTVNAFGVSVTILQYTGTGSIYLVEAASGPSLGSPITVTGTPTFGGSSITVSSVSGLSVGDVFWINHLNPTGVTTQGYSQNGTWLGEDTPTRVMAQGNRITAINGLTLSLERPLYTAFTNTPQIRKLSNYIEGVGIEDLDCRKTQTTGSQANIRLYGCVNSWIKNCRGSGIQHQGIYLWRSYACTVAFCDMDASNASWNHDSGRSYTYSLYGYNSDHHIYSNISRGGRHSVVFEGGGSGCVIEYNASIAPFNITAGTSGEYMTEDYGTHGAHPFMNLFQYNYGTRFSHDNTFGSSGRNGLYRNRLTNESSAYTSRATTLGMEYCYDIQANNGITGHGNWAIGNILCQTGDPVGTQGGTRLGVNGQDNRAMNAIRLGFLRPDGRNAANTNNNGLTDSGVATNTWMHGNWDAIGNAIVWDPTNSDHTLIDCMYGSTKPSYFGNLSWPPFDPNTPLSASASLLKLPVGYFLANGVYPPPDSGNPPTVVSAVLSANGTTFTITLSGTVTVNTSTGFALTASGGAVSLSYASGSGSSALVYTASRTIYAGETLSLAYTTVANGIEDASGNDLASFTGFSSTNSSTQNVPIVSSPVRSRSHSRGFGFFR